MEGNGRPEVPQPIKCSRCLGSARLTHTARIHRPDPNNKFADKLTAFHFCINCPRCGHWIMVEPLGTRAY